MDVHQQFHISWAWLSWWSFQDPSKGGGWLAQQEHLYPAKDWLIDRRVLVSAVVELLTVATLNENDDVWTDLIGMFVQ